MTARDIRAIRRVLGAALFIFLASVALAIVLQQAHIH